MAAKHWGAFEERRKPGGKGHLLPARALDSLAQLQGAGGEWGRSGGAQEGQGKKCQWDDAIQPPQPTAPHPSWPPGYQLSHLGAWDKQLKYRNVNLN